MILLTPLPNITRQYHPCPNCHASTPVEVITRIESEEALTIFFTHGLNRARCSDCGGRVEALVRVRVRLLGDTLINHECVPIALLDNLKVLDDLLQDTPTGLKRVYSHDELERSIEACLLIEMHRRGHRRAGHEKVFSR
jgi:hypothetical protein